MFLRSQGILILSRSIILPRKASSEFMGNAPTATNPVNHGHIV